MTSAAVPPPELTTGRQGHYAGGISRLAAFAVDVGAAWGLFTLGAGATSLISQLLVGRSLNLSKHAVITAVVLAGWLFFYFAFQWSLGGRTIGMALFGVRVVRADGRGVGPRQAAVRTLALPLSIIALGLGFVGILTNRRRYAWHDRLARTAVVYDWDARAARLRWLARRGTDGAPPTTPR